MKRLLTLLALAASAAAGAAAALMYRQTELDEAREDYQSAVADLTTCQDAQFALMDERDNWRGLAQLQQQTILRLSAAEAIRPETQTGDGGIWLYKDGWCAARGPYLDEQQARADAEEAATQYPGETIHVLTSTRTVVAAAAEPQWDNV